VINNNTYFRVLVSTVDSAGASEISNADRVNVIGGGAIHEQEILLENSIHAYTTTNRRAVLECWAIGAPSASTTNYLSEILHADHGTSFVEVLEAPATIGADRNSLTAVVNYQGSVKVEVFDTSLVSLDSVTLTSRAAPFVADGQLSWSTADTDIIIKVSLAAITSPSSADGYIWGVRILEDQTAL
jgi:hypothetical protein